MTENDSLDQQPFSYEVNKAGKVRIFRSHRLATTLRGKEALRFLNRIDAADEGGAQLIMARATGQFKFGNEKERRSPKRGK